MPFTTRSPAHAPSLDVRWDRRGLHLVGGALAFDCPSEDGAAFVGHALAAVPRSGQRIITSDLTARLLGARLGQALATPFGRRFSLGPLELTLLPNGFVPGSAALAVGLGGRVLLYAGEPGRGAPLCGLPAAAPHRCDHLVIRPTSAGPEERPAGVEETLGRVVGFAERARREGRITLLHGSPLGPLQALVEPLRAAGLAVRAHRRVHRFFAPLRAAGVPLGPVPRFEGEPVPGEAILWPVEAEVPHALARTPSVARALLTTIGRSAGRAAEAGCEACFPMGNELSCVELEAYVEACRPARVSLLGSRAPALERALSRHGIAFEVLGLPDQLDLFDLEEGAAHSRGS